MVDSKENKSSEKNSQKVRKTTVVQSSEVPATSQSQQGESTKRKPSTRTRAADRILARLEKTKTQKIARQVKEKLQEPPEEIPAKPTPQTEREIEFSLTGDLAQAAQALKQDIISEESLISAFLSQLKSAKRDEPRSLLTVLKEEHKLAAKHYAVLENIEKAVVTHKKTAPRRLDFILGQQLLEQNMITREELQQILRIQVDLRKLGVNRALDQLLIASKMISADLLKPLMAQFTNPAELTIKGRGAAIQGKSPQSYPVLIWAMAITLLFLGSSFALLYFLMLGEDKARAAKHKDAMAIKTPTRATKTVKINLPYDLYAEEEKKYGKKQANQRRLNAGLAPWGKFWIPRKHKKKLLAQKLISGRPLRDTQLSFSKSPKITVKRTKKSYALRIKGKLTSHKKNLPILPAGLRVIMQVQLFHPFRQYSLPGAKLFFLDDHCRFKVTLGSFSKKLPANLYYVRLSLPASRQKKFLNYLFSIQGNYEWWFPFFSQNSHLPEKCDARRRFVDEDIQTLYRQYLEMREIAQHYHRQDKRPKQSFRYYWEKQAPKWKSRLEKMQRKLNDKHASELLPVYPRAESGLPKMLIMLTDIYAKWDNWQRDRSYEVLDMEREYIQFELEYEEVRMALDSEYQKLSSILTRELQKNESEENED